MSFVPGADGDKSVFKDGIQVDHVSENTVGHGARVRGISDPTSYPVSTGDVGEELFVVQAANVVTNTSTYTTICTLTLTTGVWSVGVSSYADNTTTQEGHYAGMFVKGANGNVLGNDVLTASVPANKSSSICFCPRVITISSGDSDKTVVLKQVSYAAAGNGRGMIRATRIA